MRWALPVLVAALAVGGFVGWRALDTGRYASENRRLDRALPQYPGTRLVGRKGEAARSTTGGATIRSVQTKWLAPRAVDEIAVRRWFARRLRGWSQARCGTGWQRGDAIVDVTTHARTIYTYVDARAGEHCADVPAG